ncbi:PA0069 family radical SAM protein [Qingshengfaniella alkalisoli]|uniref:PA0069 family radical SAM protein n=1 Tax=Qingshengfaniella alkalisoli TaxID=2599296 RepID=A0A5B8IX11_9RHOB|nr:PA0069 family radical SAM protein [Qingshengfaniella alkalisoli]QDY70254.1 PA0069 family radical SAM protein [Qingshengfaniella alkalisoli]
MESDDRNISPGTKLRGRGAGSNLVGRYERHAREAMDDGWDIPHDASVLRTEVAIETPRSVLSRNTSPDIPFDRSINPYRGCEHGCVYCFARPTHAYLGLSPGLDFETRLVARPDAAKVLDRELRRKSYRPATIAIGTNTDPYQPIERDFGIMRQILSLLRDFQHPVGIVTKGALIERDIDILSELAAQGLTRVGVSLTTLNTDVARRMEPRVPGPKRRLRMIERLSAAGIQTRIMMSPVVPGLTDHEIEAVLKAGRDAGAVAASYITLRLPLEVAPLFTEWLDDHFPDRAAHVMNRVREMQGGKDYDPQWGQRMRGAGPHADLIAKRFKLAAKRLGLDRKLPPLRIDLFAPPLRRGNQMSLF